MKQSQSLLENLDPRSKILSFLAIIFCMVLTPITRLKDFELYFLLIIILGFLSKVTPAQVLKKVLILIPFVLFIALFVPFLKEGHECCSIQILGWKLSITHEGIWTFLNIIIKSSLSILIMVIASATTPFPDFLKALGLLKTPPLLVMIMSFMYRYIFVLLDEAKRLMRARSLRSFGHHYKEQFHAVGYMIGVLFIRTFERSERIYHAMVVRGFSGEIPTIQRFRFSSMDFLFIIGIIISLLFIVSGVIYKIEHTKIIHFHLWLGL